MNPWLLFVLVVLISIFLLESIAQLLNLKALKQGVPQEFTGDVSTADYTKTQAYITDHTWLILRKNTVVLFVTITFILLGGFNVLDIAVRNFNLGDISTGILYLGGLLLATSLMELPFTIYSTFSIEQRYDLNRTTISTFITDRLKGLLLAILLGAPLLGLILWFFERTGSWAWIACWGGVTVFTVIIQFLAPVLIMPLFNRFTPLEDGELKKKIKDYAQQENFAIQGIYTMDGSKRSTKLNAFFTGFGSTRKIVFYDTLLAKLNNDEILAVLAHEMGHYRRHHLLKMMVISTLQTGVIFYALSLILNNTLLFAAFGMEHISTYAALVFFGFLYTPVSLVLTLLVNWISRVHEFQADHYVIRSSDQQSALIHALKKLGMTNMAHLSPHPLTVFLHASHPPLGERIAKLR
ncbi:MAG: M48 family metallopeptidase [Desulfobulbaceae bacterium]|uniref:M48 family metallopeptidase n=1 Tax=Candidatus Desulfatifera sulfidica TaxID=2841691 RepID=A0A8J6TDJ4_9BACT|nr:M48 family metallopeptidase [Candidatus Desulfatifera sulfidica]